MAEAMDERGTDTMILSFVLGLVLGALIGYFCCAVLTVGAADEKKS